MKILMLGALALTTALAPVVASAQSVRDARQDRREAVQDLRRADNPREAREARQDLRDANRDLARAQDRREMRRWRTGQRLDRRYGGYSEVRDWRSRRLPAPRRGYHWVRQGNDYVLAALAGGLIASVIAANN